MLKVRSFFGQEEEQEYMERLKRLTLECLL